jgi:hypothetical protein
VTGWRSRAEGPSDGGREGVRQATMTRSDAQQCAPCLQVQRTAPADKMCPCSLKSSTGCHPSCPAHRDRWAPENTDKGCDAATMGCRAAHLPPPRRNVVGNRIAHDERQRLVLGNVAARLVDDNGKLALVVHLRRLLRYPWNDDEASVSYD